MSAPVRIQLSRKAGFRLHQVSHALNGLPARRVDRASPFGNPFRFRADEGVFLITTDEEGEHAANLVALFRGWVLTDPAGQAVLVRARSELRGHNLACWCRLDRDCHADVLLELIGEEAANALA